ncbi:hypothetical protein FisN_9Hh221 [Fistulifera solaris]|uniref:Uncharacterized protein n=1 Tax=Fistulifera solaris TaxID=1519565 RepID=A0A1Z5JAZ4_FISSO|nr:hypothetical protein FisN_9Hh221 [Fistulifera solaris]|eukprot:GAX11129.1 hypothetical protein FisN_9Hh221 [Fistulifera solaris]
MTSTEHTKEEETSLRSAALDDQQKTSQGADLLLSLAETASEHAQLSVQADTNSRNITEKFQSETEIQAPESIRSHHLPHPYGWQRPYYYHHPYGGMHPLAHYPPHYPVPTEEVPSSPLRKRVVLESIDLSPDDDDDVKRPRLEESRQESSPTSQSPRSTTDYPDEKGATKRESVISPSSSSSNETTQPGGTDNDSQTARPTSRPSTPGLTSDLSRQYPGYHGPPYIGYTPGFSHYQYGAHPSIAYHYPSFYYRGGMMPSYNNNNTNHKPTVSPTPPRDDRNAMKGLVLAARSDLLKSFPASDSNCHRCIPLKQPLPGRRWSRDAEQAQQSAMPEFSQLVNFPDYLARGREGKTGAAATGQKNCVMCGKLRPCSASTMNRRGSTDGGEDDGAMHIIPRQNKGVCTACDVAVWAVAGAKLEDGTPIEIKWCKGCKNFRPWAAFGDKGMATKCVRCRTRQKEKYAAAKESVKLELPRAIEAYAR